MRVGQLVEVCDMVGNALTKPFVRSHNAIKVDLQTVNLGLQTVNLGRQIRLQGDQLVLQTVDLGLQLVRVVILQPLIILQPVVLELELLACSL